MNLSMSHIKEVSTDETRFTQETLLLVRCFFFENGQTLENWTILDLI